MKINFLFAADLDFVGERGELLEPPAGSVGSRQDQDRRKMVFENFRVWVDGTGATDDYPEIVFAQMTSQPQSAISGGAGTEFDGTGIQCARPGHYGVGTGAQFQQVMLVALAAEFGDAPIGGGDLAI